MRGHKAGVWQLQDAKARFSEVFDRAIRGEPQTVTRRGKEAVVIVSRDQFESLARPERSLVSFLLDPRFRGSELEIPRFDESYVQRVDFSKDD